MNYLAEKTACARALGKEHDTGSEGKQRGHCGQEGKEERGWRGGWNGSGALEGL